MPFPTLGNIPNPGIEQASLVSPALAGGFFTTVPPGKPQTGWTSCKNNSRGKRDKIIKADRNEEVSREFLSFFPLYQIK